MGYFRRIRGNGIRIETTLMVIFQLLFSYLDSIDFCSWTKSQNCGWFNLQIFFLKIIVWMVSIWCWDFQFPFNGMSNLVEILLWYNFDGAAGCGIEMKSYFQCQLKPDLKNISSFFNGKHSMLNFLMKHIELDLKLLAGFICVV